MSPRLLVVAALGLLLVRDATAKPRVVVLGFDGADATITQTLLDQGKLPNLARLRAAGTFAPLATTNPPQTPVSWSSFATGLNPGRTTIFDFLKRNPRTYNPTFALNEESSLPFLWGTANNRLGALVGVALGALLVGAPLALFRRTRRHWWLGALLGATILGPAGYRAFGRLLPERRPIAINNRQGTTFWDIAAKAGLTSRIIRVPATFPATPLAHGEFLSGLGVPDIRGTVGTFSYYTTEYLEVSEDSEFGGKVVELDPFDASARTEIFGPRNRLFYNPDAKTKLDPENDPKDINLPMTFTKVAGRLRIDLPDQSLELEPGQWSNWIELTFPFNSIIRMRGFCRFHLTALEPDLKLYLSPINIHPKAPPIPLSSPPGFAWDLKGRVGFYKTIGWQEDTWSYTEKRVSEDVFLADVEETINRDQAILLDLLTKQDFDLFVQVFTFTDRISHVFWRFTDPEHPAHDAELARRYGNQIETAYLRMDAIVGKALALVGNDPETLFLVASDHGFATWHRSVNYNTWLVKNGYMTLFTSLGGRKLTLDDLFGNKQMWPYVDWSRTRAYSLGLGNIYVNLKGREPQGIVEAGAAYEALVSDIRSGLEGLVDPATGKNPVRHVYRREEMYHGFDPDLIPDMRAANNPGYRVSWQSSVGATPAEVFEVNDKPWSADHCSLDPEAVPGILFSNRALAGRSPAIIDLAPTILAHLRLETPQGLDGRSLLRTQP